MARQSVWLESLRMSVAVGTPFRLPMDLQYDCRGALAAYVLLYITDYSGGTLAVYADTTVAPTSQNETSGAWANADDETGITAAATKVLAITPGATNPVMGLLNLRFQATGSTVNCTVRAEILLKEPCDYASMEWLAGRYVNASSSIWIMSADQWADASGHSMACALVELEGTGGEFITATLQTSPAPCSDDSGWLDVASGTVAPTSVSNGGRLLFGRSMDAVPPMGPLRLKLVIAGGTATGTVRAQLLLKKSA